MKKLLLLCICTLCGFGAAFATEVDQNELIPTEDKPVEFITDATLKLILSEQ